LHPQSRKAAELARNSFLGELPSRNKAPRNKQNSRQKLAVERSKNNASEILYDIRQITMSGNKIWEPATKEQIILKVCGHYLD
jgi:uncharacterized protein YutE (UPF0331/DUF86 family)